MNIITNELFNISLDIVRNVHLKYIKEGKIMKIKENKKEIDEILNIKTVNEMNVVEIFNAIIVICRIFQNRNKENKHISIIDKCGFVSCIQYFLFGGF